MQLRYLGFDQLENARAYRFGVIGRSEDDRQFVITVDLGLFRKYGVAIQEGPSLCAQKLAADLEGLHDGAHELTMNDLQAFVSRRADEDARRLQSRKGVPRRPKAPASAQSPWRGLQV